LILAQHIINLSVGGLEMPNTFEDVKLTDTTTSYRVQREHVDLEESLDDSYARNRTEYEEQKRASDESSNETTSSAPVSSTTE
jgi:hypothetical protein